MKKAILLSTSIQEADRWKRSLCFGGRDLSIVPLCAVYLPSFLEPSIPVPVQFLSAAFLPLAVAAAPTFRHVVDANAGETAMAARVVVERPTMFALQLGSADHVRKTSSNQRLEYSIHI